MKKIFSTLALLAFVINANAQFQTTDSIVNNNCRIEFYNSTGIKIYEMIANNLTWWKQSNGAFVIRDRVTQVTLSTTFSGFPALSNMEDSLNNWIVNCQGCCGSGGGASVGLNTFQFSDGSGGFFEVNDTIIDEGDTTLLYIGLGSGMASIASGANNVANGDISVAMGLGNTANGFASAAMGAGNTSNGFASATVGAQNINNVYGGLVVGAGNSPDSGADPENPAALDEVLQIASAPTLPNALFVQRNGNLSHKGAYANTSYVNYTVGNNALIQDNISLFIYNPATTVSGMTITLPYQPIDGQHLTILAGGTVTAGDVITSFTLDGNGRTIVGDICPKLTVNEMIELVYIGATDIWYIISNCK